jgi:hypothetical protein
MAICFLTCESRDGLELFCLYCAKIQFKQNEKNITILELRLRLPSTCENQKHTRQTSKTKGKGEAGFTHINSQDKRKFNQSNQSSK